MSEHLVPFLVWGLAAIQVHPPSLTSQCWGLLGGSSASVPGAFPTVIDCCLQDDSRGPLELWAPSCSIIIQAITRAYSCCKLFLITLLLLWWQLYPLQPLTLRLRQSCHTYDNSGIFQPTLNSLISQTGPPECSPWSYLSHSPTKVAYIFTSQARRSWRTSCPHPPNYILCVFTAYLGIFILVLPTECLTKSPKENILFSLSASGQITTWKTGPPSKYLSALSASSAREKTLNFRC
jgi:hypothetical protein